MDRADARGSQTREQALAGDRVVDQIAIAREMKAVRLRARQAHRDDVFEVAIIAAAHHRHRRAVARRLGDAQLPIHGRDHLEAKARVVVRTDLGKQQREVRAVAGRALDQLPDQIRRDAAAADRR